MLTVHIQSWGDFSSGEKKMLEKLEKSAFLVSKDLLGIGKFHAGSSEESWSAFSLSIPTPSCTLGSFSTGFGYPEIQTFWALLGMKCLMPRNADLGRDYVGEAFFFFLWQSLKAPKCKIQRRKMAEIFYYWFLNWRCSPWNRIQDFFWKR